MNKEIMEIIQDYMDKSLSEGVLLKTPRGEIVKLFRVVNHSREEIEEPRFSSVAPRYTKEWNDFECIKEDGGIYHYGMFGKDKILGHYDITAVFKYIGVMGFEVEIDDKFVDNNYNGDLFYIEKEGFLYGELLNKPLHLYTPEEQTNLLKLLKQLGKIAPSY